MINGVILKWQRKRKGRNPGERGNKESCRSAKPLFNTKRRPFLLNHSKEFLKARQNELVSKSIKAL